MLTILSPAWAMFVMASIWAAMPDAVATAPVPRFEGGDALFENGGRGVVQAGVDVPRFREGENGGALFRTFEACRPPSGGWGRRTIRSLDRPVGLHVLAGFRNGDSVFSWF